jgi:methylated-DNA-[protein]-cysteine S-methyltransferase
MREVWIDHLETPVGRLHLLVNPAGRLCSVGWGAPVECYVPVVPVANPAGLTAALAAYFAGELTAIDGLPVADVEGTEFQHSVWRALREIPCGETRSYGDIARRIGKPAAVRAVGLANNANPIGIVVPCHRVIGADGSLTGYGGGLDRKRWLLAHERSAGRTLELPF